MALAHTAEELINKTAAILGKYVPGEALGDVEHVTISRCIDSTLASIDKIVVVDRDQVPNALFDAVARLVAIYAAADFSNQPPMIAVIQEHEQRLRYLIAQTPTYEVLATNHF